MNPHPIAVALALAGRKLAKTKTAKLAVICKAMLADADEFDRAEAEMWLGQPAPTLEHLPKWPAGPLKGRGNKRVEVRKTWGTKEIISCLPKDHHGEISGGLSGVWVAAGQRIVSPEAHAIIKPALDWLKSEGKS